MSSRRTVDGESPLAPLKAQEKPLETQKQVEVDPSVCSPT